MQANLQDHRREFDYAWSIINIQLLIIKRYAVSAMESWAANLELSVIYRNYGSFSEFLNNKKNI